MAFWWIGRNPPSTVEVTGLRLTQPVKRSIIVEETENKGTENQDLEQTPPASESVISEEKAVAKFTALRHRAQAAEVEAAELRGKLEGIQEATTKAAPPAVSPLDAEIARQAAEGIPEDEMTVSPAIYRKHEIFKEQVANQKTVEQAKADKNAIMDESKAAAKLKNPDWVDIVTAGQGHLTPGELLDLENAGVDFGEQAYAKCKAATERANPKTETPAPETKPGEPEKKVEAKKPELPTQQEILDAAGDPVIAAAMEL